MVVFFVVNILQHSAMMLCSLAASWMTFFCNSKQKKTPFLFQIKPKMESRGWFKTGGEWIKIDFSSFWRWTFCSLKIPSQHRALPLQMEPHYMRIVGDITSIFILSWFSTYESPRPSQKPELYLKHTISSILLTSHLLYSLICTKNENIWFW